MYIFNLKQKDKMSSNCEDDDPGSQSSLDYMMEASCLDDWGATRGIVERIMGICWPWSGGRYNNRNVGHGKNLDPVSVVSQET